MAFDILEFENRIFDQLNNKLIEEWFKYQSNDDVIEYDMIYFEYHEQSIDFTEAMSYGIFNMEDYKLTIGSYDFGYNYQTSYWEAGLGLDLDPFKLTQEISYRSINDDKRFDLIDYGDPNSGSEQIWNTIHAICNYAFNKSFQKADKLNMFSDLKIKQGGIFTYDMHDNGSVKNAFYIKT